MELGDEARFLAEYAAEDFARPSVAVDVVLIGIRDEALCTLLVRRNVHPALGAWALPGGFVRIDESLDSAAARVLASKAGVANVFVEQLYTFGRPDRDPRTRIISIAYYALVAAERLERTAISESAGLHKIRAGRASHFDIVDDLARPLEIAFDHREIVAMAVKRLQGKLNYTPVGYELLPSQFTLLQLQRVHEIILGNRVNKDSFRRRMLASGELEHTGTLEDGVDYRPAALYRRRPQGDPNG